MGATPIGRANGPWCNSNTPDSESGIRGANPCGPISSRFGVVVARFSEKEEVLERYQEVALARGAGSSPVGTQGGHLVLCPVV